MSKYGQVSNVSPVWVSGVYRSGTTFMAALIGGHRDFVSTSSTIKFIRFNLDRFGDVSQEDNARALLADIKRRIAVRWQIDFDDSRAFERASKLAELSYAGLYESAMQEMLASDGENVRWLEKLALQWRDIPKFFDMFPNGRVVHVIRDPRDVTASYKHMTFEKGFTYLDAAFNCLDSMKSIEIYREKYGEERYLALKIEDISADPESCSQKICQFLGVDYYPEMLDGTKFSVIGEEWASNTSFGGDYKAIPKPKARWPEYLSPAETMFVEMICQSEMSKFAYKGSGIFPTEQQWLEMYEFLKDDHIANRFKEWLATGEGAQGYRTDPFKHEMNLVYGNYE